MSAASVQQGGDQDSRRTDLEVARLAYMVAATQSLVDKGDEPARFAAIDAWHHWIRARGFLAFPEAPA
jgi:hypothetical protein